MRATQMAMLIRMTASERFHHAMAIERRQDFSGLAIFSPCLMPVF